MSTSASQRILTIDGMHPAEYASLWGDGATREGAMYYNCSDNIAGRVIANPDWTAEDWREFAEIVHRQADEVRCAVDCGKPGDWTEEDVTNLDLLERWALDNASGGVVRFWGVEGESGAELFRASERVVFGFAGGGSKDAHADRFVDAPEVEWLADADTIRKALKSYGAWDAEELADDEANRRRILWAVCSDLMECDNLQDCVV